MDYISRYNKGHFLRVAQKIKQQPTSWQLIDISLSGKTSHNIPYIAKLLTDHFARTEGLIIPCSNNQILTIANLGNSVDLSELASGINSRLPALSCTVDAATLVVCGVLRDAGLRVIEAGNAEEALTFLKTGERIDLVFTDVHMPGPLNGAGLVRLMRTYFPSVKVIMASGDLQQKDAEPDVPLIEKPYVLRQLVSIILANLDQIPVSTTL